MGFWRFGKQPAHVEMVSRVVTARTGDGVETRGKLTVRFTDPVTQEAADAAADRCAAATLMRMSEAPTADALMRDEKELSHQIRARLPASFPVRAIELEALHVVGDVGSTSLRRRAGSPSLDRFGLVTIPQRLSGSAPTPVPPAPESPEELPETRSFDEPETRVLATRQSSVPPEAPRVPTRRPDPRSEAPSSPNVTVSEPPAASADEAREAPPSSRPESTPPRAIRPERGRRATPLPEPPSAASEPPPPEIPLAPLTPGAMVACVQTLPSVDAVMLHEGDKRSSRPARGSVHVEGNALPGRHPTDAPARRRSYPAPPEELPVAGKMDELVAMADALRRAGSTSSLPPRADTGSRSLTAPSGTAIGRRSDSIRVEVPPDAGATPRTTGSALGPLVRDSASRLLLGCLHAHDLVNQQGLSGRLAATRLASALARHGGEAPVGAYEAAVREEIGAWRERLGADGVAAVAHEACLASACLAYFVLVDTGVGPTVAIGVLESISAEAFPGEKLGGELGRYLYSLEPALDAELARNVTDILAPTTEPDALAVALSPVLLEVQRDLGMAAQQVKHLLQR